MKLFNKFILFLLVFFMLGDIISTILVMNKHSIYGIESETNPLVVLGIPLWVLIIIKLIAIVILLNYYIKHHHKVKSIYMRYFMISLLLILILIHAGFVFNNLRWYKEETKDIVPIPKEERISAYTEQVMDMKVVGNIEPEVIRKIKIPLMFYILLYNFINFCVWLSFESERT